MSDSSKIPEEFRGCFWDVEFNDLDIEEDKYFIISRLYVKGDLCALKWVHETYSDDDIKETAKNRRALDPIVANYLRKKYGLQKEEMAYYKMEAVGGKELWPY